MREAIRVRGVPVGRWVGEVRGFTLIELVIVIALIAILAGISIYNNANAVTRAKEAVLKEDLFRMRDAIDQYYADKGKYPANLEALVTDQYLREVPKDPFTQSSTTWQEIPAEPDPNNPSAEPGIFNVKSGAEQAALDGTKYSDW